MKSFLALSVVFAVPLAVSASDYASDQLLPAGSLIQCTTSEPKLSSKTEAIGDPVTCRVSHAVHVGRSVLPYDSYLVGRFEDYRDPYGLAHRPSARVETPPPPADPQPEPQQMARQDYDPPQYNSQPYYAPQPVYAPPPVYVVQQPVYVAPPPVYMYVPAPTLYAYMYPPPVVAPPAVWSPMPSSIAYRHRLAYRMYGP